MSEIMSEVIAERIAESERRKEASGTNALTAELIIKTSGTPILEYRLIMSEENPYLRRLILNELVSRGRREPLLLLKELDSAIHSGYDFNKDEKQLTLRVGKMLS